MVVLDMLALLNQLMEHRHPLIHSRGKSELLLLVCHATRIHATEYRCNSIVLQLQLETLIIDHLHLPLALQVASIVQGFCRAPILYLYEGGPGPLHV